MKHGDAVIHCKQNLLGSVDKIVDAIVCGKPTKLVLVNWKGNPEEIPMRWADERFNPYHKGYLKSELKLVNG